MFATTDLIAPLAKRGIELSSSQVYRLVVERPERLSLKMLMALLDILDCTMDDLIEPVATVSAATTRKKAVGADSQRRRSAAQAGPHPWIRSIVNVVEQDRAIADPIGLITDLVAAAEPHLALDRISSVAAAVAGGRAKSRRLATALAARPGVLLDGRSPAPRVVGELLRALRAAGATVISPPCCAGCGKHLRTFTRRGADWYCGSLRTTTGTVCWLR